MRIPHRGAALSTFRVGVPRGLRCHTHLQVPPRNRAPTPPSPLRSLGAGEPPPDAHRIATKRNYLFIRGHLLPLIFGVGFGDDLTGVCQRFVLSTHAQSSKEVSRSATYAGRKRCVIDYAVARLRHRKPGCKHLSTRDFASARASVSDFAVAFDVKQSIIGR